MTDVSDHNLCPRTLWTPVFPRKILLDPRVQCNADLLDPKGSLSVSLLLSLSASHSPSSSLWHTLHTLILKGHREKKREMAPVIFPLLTGALQRSLSQSPQGEDIKQRKNLSHFIVFYHRELISLSSLCLSSFFLHFSHIPPHSSSHPSSFRGLCTSPSIFIFYKVWRFDNALWACQLVKIQRGQRGEKKRRVGETLQSRGETLWVQERRDGCLSRVLTAVCQRTDVWGAEKQAGRLTCTEKTPEVYVLKMCK